MDFSEPNDQGVIRVTYKMKGATVTPTEDFKPGHDAEHLRKAIKGLGTDEAAIISILGSRTRGERKEIEKAYETKFEKNLIKDLKGDLSGNFETTVLHLMWSSWELEAKVLKNAMKGLGTDESVLIDLICTKNSKQLDLMKNQYALEYNGKNLADDIAKETSGAFRTFLLAVLKGERAPDDGTVYADQADKDAKVLSEMNVRKWSPDDPQFLEIFTKRSFEHLWYMWNSSWPKVSTYSGELTETIELECLGDFKNALKAIVRYSLYIPSVYYAHRLHGAMKGLGTRDNQLIYIVSTRCEVDMADIKDEYARLFGSSLAAKIKGDTSGDYRKLLLKLIGEE